MGMTLGDYIRRKMDEAEAKGEPLTQQDVADRIGIKQQQVSNWLQKGAKVDPLLSTVAKVAWAFKDPIEVVAKETLAPSLEDEERLRRLKVAERRLRQAQADYESEQ